MGLEGYRLWVMGQLDSNVQRPTEVRVGLRVQRGKAAARGAGSARESGGEEVRAAVV
jgi:hypothetical protein